MRPVHAVSHENYRGYPSEHSSHTLHTTTHTIKSLRLQCNPGDASPTSGQRPQQHYSCPPLFGAHNVLHFDRGVKDSGRVGAKQIPEAVRVSDLAMERRLHIWSVGSDVCIVNGLALP